MSSQGPIPPKPPHSPGSQPAGDVPRPAPAPGYAGSGPAFAGAPGAPQEGPHPSAPGHQGRPRERGRKRRLPLILSLCAIGVVLVLVAVGIITVMNVNRTQYGPDVIAQEYLDAVAAGDLEAAQDIVEATVPNGADTSLLTPEITAAAAAGIEAPQIAEVHVDGDRAELTATYSIDGQAYEMALTAQKAGRTGIFFDEWALDPPVLPTLSLDLVQTDGVSVNDVPVTLQSGSTEYAVMPGTYSAAVEETKYTEAAQADISLGFAADPEPQPAALDVSIHTTDEYAKDVQTAVEKKLEECVDSEKLETACGFFDRDAFASEDEKEQFDTLKTEGVDYDLAEMPTITVSSLALTSTGSFFTEEDNRGRVEAVVEAENGDKYQLEADLGPSGTARIEDDAVVIDFIMN
ncbi:hypothetical protein [Brevibacterium album]|uniref:hypothetical protein n=1 Tax=Brevibacterium album TaxID=417948 RepID=UPI00041FFB16|nr:hypothetical protein [Brevibacterium album]